MSTKGVIRPPPDLALSRFPPVPVLSLFRSPSLTTAPPPDPERTYQLAKTLDAQR